MLISAWISAWTSAVCTDITGSAPHLSSSTQQWTFARMNWISVQVKHQGNKMPTRCTRGFYCRSYCLLNMFRAPLCPLSRAQEYYTVVAACGISCCGFQVAGLVWSWGLCVSSTPDQLLENHNMKYHRQQPLYNTLELLVMGIVVPETCWASNKICNKNPCCI